MSSLLKLAECGQSYWMDNLTRGKIQSGELKKRAEEHGLRGITSNPAIFNKAISKSSDYDDQIRELAKSSKEKAEIYEKVVIKDIQDACDVLKSVYEKTDKLDGYVSLEVSPLLAHDTEGTIKEVRRLWKEVDRPNLMVKIPGTKEGLPAIEQMLAEGININITLLFSVKVYEEVAHAYIRALEKRVENSQPIEGIASVASFFLSRIDVMVDKLLEHRKTSQKIDHLLGQVAVANAKLAYQSFKKIFSGEKWEKLKAKGASVQRPLWASTSTKNPDYNDVMYVEPLIGEHTVNTLPDKTIDAFADHGKVECGTVEQGVEEAQKVLNELPEHDIDLDFVTAQLVNEGIQKFVDPYNELLGSIEKKIGEVGVSG